MRIIFISLYTYTLRFLLCTHCVMYNCISGKLFFKTKSVAPLGIVPKRNGGLWDVGFVNRLSSRPDKFGNSSRVIINAA